MRLDRAIVAAILLAGCFGVVLAQPQGQQGTIAAETPAATLPAFGNITSCLPLNVLVKPSAQGSSNAYSLATDAGAEVAAALRAVVVDGTLFLGFNKSFESTTPIRVTVSLPADKLQSVENKGVGQLIINPGFKTTTKVALTTSSGRILARNLSTRQLVVEASGVAVVFARGDIRAAQVTADGTSTVTLSGVTKTVKADLSGISKLYVDAASDAVVITPSADGLSKVYYNKGKCDSKKKSMFMDMGFFSMDLDMGPFGSCCVQLDDPEDYPSYAALWSCGMRVRGMSVCAPGDVAAQEAARDATVISVASANSARGGYSQASASATGASPATASFSPPPPTPTPTPTPKPTPPPTPTPTPTPPPTPTPAPKEAGPTIYSTNPTNPQPSRLQGKPEPEAGAKRPTIDRLAADIRVAAAGKRRRLSSTDHWLFGDLDDVFSSSSSSSSSSSGGGRRRSEAVAVASLECEAPDTELFIAA